MIGVGVIGLGFMGSAHVRAYASAAAGGAPCALRAVCDARAERLSGAVPEAGNSEGTGDVAAGDRLFDPGAVRGYTSVDDLLADPAVDAVSVCTYTDTHAEIAGRALRAGKHVLVEKPVSLCAREIRALSRVAAESGRLCMPGMCMRFWPGWDWLRDRVRAGTFGGVRSATFQRLGSGPGWAVEFYRDTTRSGGALADLHIHDTDFVCWCFGRPRAVVSAGSPEHLTTLYRFEERPAHVTAEGGWSLVRAAGFRMRYLVAFDEATAEFDLRRTPSLVLHRRGASEPVAIAQESAYELEVRHFVEAAASESGDLRATLEDAAGVAEVLDAERRSLETGAPVVLSAWRAAGIRAVPG